MRDYLAAADLGAQWSQNRMGWNYMMGINVPVNYAKAKHYLDLSAAQGNNTAKENLIILNKLLAQPGTSQQP
jgi:TPR repeat protein